MTYRLSIAERIALTSALRARDQRVLLELAGCGDFETGRNCRPNWKTLAARTGLSRATLARALVDLKAGGWIVPTAHRHRHPTTYAIAIDRLAENATQAKVVAGSACGKPPAAAVLGSQFETQDPDLGSQFETQDPDLGSQFETPPKYVRTATPSTYRDPSAPALRAPADPSGLTAAKPKGESLPPWELFNQERRAAWEGDGHAATTLRAGGADVRPGDQDPRDDAGARAAGPRGDQAAPPGPGVHVPEFSDPPGDPRPQHAVPRVGPPDPSQPSLALFADVNGDVNTRTARPTPQWDAIAAALRKGLERKSG